MIKITKDKCEKKKQSYFNCFKGQHHPVIKNGTKKDKLNAYKIQLNTGIQSISFRLYMKNHCFNWLMASFASKHFNINFAFLTLN